MMSNNFASQSTEARNSANVRISNIDTRVNGGNYKWQVEKINIINEFFNAEFFSEDGLLEGAEVVILVNSEEVYPRLYVDGVVFWPKNMSCFKSNSKSERAMMAEMFDMAKDAALCMGDCENKYYPLSYPYVPWIDAYIAERNIEPQWAAFNEAPCLDEAPCLEEDEDDDITDEGYSVAGLKYLEENMPVVPIDAIMAGVREYLDDSYVVSQKYCGGRYECDFEEFADIIWSYVWPNVCPMSDEALEAETRYYMEFDVRLRYMLENEYFGALEFVYGGIVRGSLVVAA